MVKQPENMTRLGGAKVLIRDFNHEDIAPVFEILRRNGQYDHPDVDGPEAMRRVKECDAAVFLVCELAGKTVGLVRGVYDGSRAMIHLLSVHPEHQRQGVGIALVEHIVKRFEERGAPSVSATITHDSLGFWKKVGFSRTGAFLVGNW